MRLFESFFLEGKNMSDNMANAMKRKLSGKNVTAIILFSAIILVFVFFGYQGRLGAGGAGVVGRVNDSLISIADFSSEESRVEEYYKNMFGSQIDFSSQRQLLRQQALENLIRMELVSQAAAKDGILVTDLEVRDFIVKDIPFFLQNGQFQRDAYSRYLEATHSSPADFEGKVRKDVANVRLHHLFEIGSSPSTVELKQVQALHDQKIDVAFVKINQEALNKDLGKEKAEATVKTLDEALAKGDESMVNNIVKTFKGTSWEETGFVDLGSDSIPKLNTPAASEGVFELTSAQPLLKRLVRDGNFKYILKLKGVKTEAGSAPEASAMEMNSKRRAEGQFEAWINQFRKESHVSMNTEALQQP